jgi:membrane carboxypeptidase/penicillin-binding protein PbpC
MTAGHGEAREERVFHSDIDLTRNPTRVVTDRSTNEAKMRRKYLLEKLAQKGFSLISNNCVRHSNATAVLRHERGLNRSQSIYEMLIQAGCLLR